MRGFICQFLVRHFQSPRQLQASSPIYTQSVNLFVSLLLPMVQCEDGVILIAELSKRHCVCDRSFPVCTSSRHQTLYPCVCCSATSINIYYSNLHVVVADSHPIAYIAEKRFHQCYRCYRSVVCLTVTSVHCDQKAEDTDKIFFAYDSPMSLPDRVKIWLTLVNLFLPKLCPTVTQVTHPLLI